MPVARKATLPHTYTQHVRLSLHAPSDETVVKGPHQRTGAGEIELLNLKPYLSLFFSSRVTYGLGRPCGSKHVVNKERTFV